LELAKKHPVLDVRSPGEYKHAHIPGAYSFPLFTDEERKVVGTAYKQQSREEAIKIGFDYFGPKMRKMVEDAEELVRSRKSGVGSKTAIDYSLLTIHYLNKNLQKSNPKAYAISPNSRIIPTIWAYSMNLSPGLRPVIIS